MCILTENMYILTVSIHCGWEKPFRLRQIIYFDREKSNQLLEAINPFLF